MADDRDLGFDEIDLHDVHRDQERFPQAFAHLGLSNSSLYLAAAQGREIPLPSLSGSDDHRQEG